MTKRLRFTRPSSRTSLVLVLAALAVPTLPLGAGASESDGLDTHPPDPPDVSSPEATLYTFFSEANNGTFVGSSAESNGGTYSGNLVANVPPGTSAPSFPLVKQANIGVGIVQPNSSVSISFDLFGSLGGSGGVVVAEFFSELTGGGTSSTEILSGGPLFPNPPNDWTAAWVTYTFTADTGPDVTGGVTLQLKADCGANPGCTINAYFDNVSVKFP